MCIDQRRKKIAIIGSTGTIGANCVEVIRQFPDKFEVVALTAFHNHLELEKQINEFRPRCIAVAAEGCEYLKGRLSGDIEIYDAALDLEIIAGLPEVDILILGMSGGAALRPFLAAVQAGKKIATANKEALVIAGHILMAEARKSGAEIIPIDSEQSAIFQCLEGNERSALEKIFLTASGGALLHVPVEDFDSLDVATILNHPRWKMGARITVDSATMMNKGFEIIEAVRLFDVSPKEIEVIVHPEAIIHSMVAFQDGSIMAQLGVTDMRLPIQYALTHPNRWKAALKKVDFCEWGKFTFLKPDLQKFPSLALAMEVAEIDGTGPAVLNAADEVAVEAFLKQKISFTQIYEVVKDVVHRHHPVDAPDLEDILKADQWARDESRKLLEQLV